MQAEQVLKLTIGEHEGIEGLCTWRTNKDGQKTDWQAVSAALANDPDFTDALAANTTTTPGARVLRLSK